MPDGTPRFAYGAGSLPELLESMWPGGSCQLPDNFNPTANGTASVHPLAKGENNMIFDARFCILPAHVAFRDNRYVDGKGNVTSDMRTASNNMSNILRHQDFRIQPFDNG
eukprot:9947726-Heterocapsa_arctica.AAC.1